MTDEPPYKKLLDINFQNFPLSDERTKLLYYPPIKEMALETIGNNLAKHNFVPLPKAYKDLLRQFNGCRGRDICLHGSKPFDGSDPKFAPPVRNPTMLREEDQPDAVEVQDLVPNSHGCNLFEFNVYLSESFDDQLDGKVVLGEMKRDDNHYLFAFNRWGGAENGYERLKCVRDKGLISFELVLDKAYPTLVQMIADLTNTQHSLAAVLGRQKKDAPKQGLLI